MAGERRFQTTMTAGLRRPVAWLEGAGAAKGQPRLSRRAFGLGVLAWCGASGTAGARDASGAIALVNGTVEAILALIVANLPRAETAAALRTLIEERSALRDLARFAAGGFWNDMTGSQRARYVDAFAGHVATVYAGYFRSYDGKIDDLRREVRLTGVKDLGRRGLLVTTTIAPDRPLSFDIAWVVSDRSGRLAISDLVVGGISMAVTMRETVLAMFRAAGGDPEATITTLKAYGIGGTR